MGKTKSRNFTAKTKTGLVRKKTGKSKWKREKTAKKIEEKREKEEKHSALMFKIAKENGSNLIAEGKIAKDEKKVSHNLNLLLNILTF